MSSEKEYSAEQLEAGRLLFARHWDFITSVKEMHQLPDLGGVEIAFAGRSNVGKSSLINKLTERKALARTSNTPGRTQMLNFFGAEHTQLRIVDMPGYGYAEAPKGMVDAWTTLIFKYLRGRSTLRRVFSLIDARHGIKKNDLDAMGILDKAAVPYQVVLTKADKLKPGQLERVKEDALKILAKRPAAHPEVLATSSEKGTGMDELRAEIALLVSYG
ncbi:putative GTP-binding protein EngB [Pseudovibrio axinellae]|uniref:Probable GTP-binding protein EngB n=1 Tax=Pseudovibrio axinellae TaxID=989403 RepID=A0A165ZR51_9HYPH|nr:ribosome biogenesis GTP-binding protein YihA/YsxC [Pseudovibrio axinellae]KZL20192.1 putative GTP-binding protein EngB [Pseudovibrio axinellae]SEQ60345.1 GTP-binding protein [Pseudovibrio axinellae]